MGIINEVLNRHVDLHLDWSVPQNRELMRSWWRGKNWKKN
jgi:hypothetical protein